MKKLIVAASALMLTGAMVSTAAAEVTFSGDAYTRYYAYSNWFGYGDKDADGTLTPGSVSDEDSDSWRSRVRLRMKGTTASGAFAAARFEMDNDRWGDGNGGDVTVDYAYISVPVGCVNITAGDWDFNSGFAGWFNDIGVEAVGVTWANDTTTVTGLYAVSDNDWYQSQKEDRIWALVVDHNFDNAMNLKFGVALHNNDVQGGALEQQYDDDNTGVTAQLGMSGQVGPVALAGEIGYQQDGFGGTDEMQVEQTDSDGYGFFVSAGMDFDAVNATLVAGYTADGYVFDAPVGFIMIGGDSMLSPIPTVGQYDLTIGGAPEAMDSLFIGVKTSYQATEALGLGFNMAYVDLEAADDSRLDGIDGDAFEISASLSYALADGVSVTSNVGYLNIDVDDADVATEDDDTFGAVVSLNLTF